MKVDILTLFPKMFPSVFNTSILGRAQEKNLLEIKLHDIREYAENKHRSCDDSPYGGGAGMVMMVQPVLSCIESLIQTCERMPKRIYLSPRGKVLNTSLAQELAQEEHLVLLCGHYEGIDQRIMSQIDEEISIGDYILTGGELSAMVLVDCVSRFIPGVLGHTESAFEESFSSGLLEYPQYTRPAEYKGMKVPDILLSGHHANITKWRREQSLQTTFFCRPDLLDGASLTQKERESVQSWKEQGL